MDQNGTCWMTWMGKTCTKVSQFVLMPFGNSSVWKFDSSKWTYHPAMRIGHWIQAQRFPVFFWEVVLLFLSKLNLKLFGHSCSATTLANKASTNPKLFCCVRRRLAHGPTLGPTCPPHDRPRPHGSTTASGWIFIRMHHVLLMRDIFQIFQAIVGWIAIRMMNSPCELARRRPYKSESHQPMDIKIIAQNLDSVIPRRVQGSIGHHTSGATNSSMRTYLPTSLFKIQPVALFSGLVPTWNQRRSKTPGRVEKLFACRDDRCKKGHFEPNLGFQARNETKPNETFNENAHDRKD